MFKKIITSGIMQKVVDTTIAEKEELYNIALQDCYAKRKAEYPSIADYIDADVKGDIEAKESFAKQQLAVKEKHPKPLRSDFGLTE